MQHFGESSRIAVFSSGEGTTFEAIQQATQGGVLQDAGIELLISNNPSAFVRQRARAHGIPEHAVPHDDHDRIHGLLQEHRIGVVVLAGYLRLLGPETVWAYEGRALNTHPGPLPRFGGKGMYGDHVHRAVLEAGVRYSGPTVHLVSERYDEGPVVAHEPVQVADDDTPETLADRVKQAERTLYPQAIASLIHRLQEPQTYFLHNIQTQRETLG